MPTILAAALLIMMALTGLGQLPAAQPSAVAVLSPSNTVSQSALTYTVRSGDCLYMIAQRFNTTVRSLQLANNLWNADVIYPGQQLVIPTNGQSATMEDSPAVAGDTTVNATLAETNASAPEPVPSIVMTERETAMFDALNRQRLAAGLAALQFDPTLMPIARARSEDMATRNYFSHTTPEGGTVQDLVRAAGVPYKVTNEILSRNNYPDSQSVDVSVRAFMNSDLHRAHILLALYERAAVSEARTPEGMKYFTVMLASD